MEESLDRSKITPALVRKEITKSNLSNIAIARECKIAMSKIRDFRKGDDQALSTIERIRVRTLTKRGTF